jgi:hypothetical protein
MIDPDHLLHVRPLVHRHLTKPCRSAALRDAIRDALGQARNLAGRANGGPREEQQ